MKFIKKISMKIKDKLVALFSVAMIFVIADSSYAMISQDGPIPIKQTKPGEDKGQRPKAPSMQQIYCTYEDGYLSLDFTVAEGVCLLTVTELNDGMWQTYSFDSSTYAQIYIGEVSNAVITITTAKGNTYEGEIM